MKVAIHRACSEKEEHAEIYTVAVTEEIQHAVDLLENNKKSIPVTDAESPIDNMIIGQSRQYLFRDTLTAGKVDHRNGAIVYGICEKQNLKGRRFCVAVHTAFLKVNIQIRVSAFSYVEKFTCT